MEIKINIEAEGLEKAIHALANALSSNSLTQVQTAAPEQESKQESKQDKPVKQEAAPQEKEEPEPVTETKEEKQEEQEITIDMIRPKLAAINQAGKGDELQALIAEFDPTGAVKPKLSNIPAEKYPELLQKASEIA